VVVNGSFSLNNLSVGSNATLNVGSGALTVAGALVQDAGAVSITTAGSVLFLHAPSAMSNATAMLLDRRARDGRRRATNFCLSFI